SKAQRGGPALVGRRIERFRGDLEGVGTTFFQMQRAICDAKPEMIYFAGRSKDLQTFAETLTDRECGDLSIDILTGDGANHLAQRLAQPSRDRDRLQAALRARVAITYTGLAHPLEWDRASADAQQDANTFREFHTLFQGAFHQEPLDDGQAMMGHDAVLAAVT